MFNFGKRRANEAVEIAAANGYVQGAAVEFIKVAVDEQLCHHCGGCVAVCPPDAIFLENSHLAINQETCTSCERCVKMCPVHALSMPNGRPDMRAGSRHA